jgi:hypothetical protein
MTIADRLFSLYRGLDRARGKNSLLADLDAKGKRRSKNQTVHQPYTVENWQKHLAGKEGLGVVPITDDATCNWGAIDIDEYPLDLVDLEQKLLKLELPFVVLRTKSGGAHVTCYFSSMQPCSEVRTKMAEVSFALGLGNREFYPKQVKLANGQDVGNWLNMPYFDAEQTERYAIKNGEPLTLTEFVDYAESLRQDSVSSIVIKLPRDLLDDGPPCLQHIVKIKAGPGERNNVLFNLGVYSRLKHESNWDAELEKLNIAHIDPPLSTKEVTAVVKSLEKKNYTFTCNNAPLIGCCNREICKRREFGITAFQHVDIGIVIDSITKLQSDPPMWIVSLDGVRTEVETDDLLDQNRFRKVCINAINKLPGRMKGEEWDKFIRAKMAEIEIVDAPVETKTKESAMMALGLFILSNPLASDIRQVRWGRTFKTQEGVLISGEKYLEVLHKTNTRVDTRKLWVALMQAGTTTDKDGNWLIPYGALPPEVMTLEPAKPKQRQSDIGY